MTISNSKKSHSVLFKVPSLVLAVCFSIITLFGSPLHDHDLDPSHVDLDCISCHLVQSNIGLEGEEPNISHQTQVTQWIADVNPVIYTAHTSFASSRAPPFFC